MPEYQQLMDRLADGDVIILDGANGSEIQRLGVDMHENAWCALATETHPGCRPRHTRELHPGRRGDHHNEHIRVRTAVPRGLRRRRYRQRPGRQDRRVVPPFDRACVRGARGSRERPRMDCGLHLGYRHLGPPRRGAYARQLRAAGPRCLRNPAWTCCSSRCSPATVRCP